MHVWMQRTLSLIYTSTAIIRLASSNAVIDDKFYTTVYMHDSAKLISYGQES